MQSRGTLPFLEYLKAALTSLSGSMQHTPDSFLQKVFSCPKRKWSKATHPNLAQDKTETENKASLISTREPKRKTEMETHQHPQSPEKQGLPSGQRLRNRCREPHGPQKQRGGGRRWRWRSSRSEHFLTSLEITFWEDELLASSHKIVQNPSKRHAAAFIFHLPGTHMGSRISHQLALEIVSSNTI